MADSPPILLLAGMGADERLFARQIDHFPTLRVPPWIEPLRRESLRSYAARMARAVDPGVPCVVGGASFGGMVAREMSAHLETIACVLIGSVRSSAELPMRWRALRPLAVCGPDALRIAASVCVNGAKPATARRLRKLTRPDGAFLRWAMCAAVRWTPSAAARRVPVFQIHGECDRTLPAGLTRPDVVVPGGGHALSLFSPAAVNEFLAAVTERTTGRPSSSASRAVP